MIFLATYQFGAAAEGRVDYGFFRPLAASDMARKLPLDPVEILSIGLVVCFLSSASLLCWIEKSY